MKGIVFSELVGFLDVCGGPVFAEKVLREVAIEDGAAYTRVGRYPWQDAVKIVEAAAGASGIPADELCHRFGVYLFGRFTVLYRDIVARYATAEELLLHVGDHIHEEVKVIYPDARPPNVWAETKDETLIVHYASHRPFAHIAHGLVAGAMLHFGDTRNLRWLVLGSDGATAQFQLAGESM